jgi:hypothetical protein
MNSDVPATPETPSAGDAPPESRAPQPAWERFLLAVHGANDDQGYLKVLKEERKEPFFARMSKNLMISESEE